MSENVETVSPELQTVLVAASKLSPRKGETPEHFSRRVAEKLNSGITDEEWNVLGTGDFGEDAQKWANDVVIAVSKKLPFMQLIIPEPSKDVSGENEQEELEMAAKATKTKANNKPAKQKATDNGNGARRGRKPRFDLASKITVLVKENPHRPGTKDFDRFKQYKSGQTVKDAIDKGLRFVDLHWHADKGMIAVK